MKHTISGSPLANLSAPGTAAKSIKNSPVRQLG